VDIFVIAKYETEMAKGEERGERKGRGIYRWWLGRDFEFVVVGVTSACMDSS